MEDFLNKLHTVNRTSITVAICLIIFIAWLPVLSVVMLNLLLAAYLSYRTLIDEKLEILNKFLCLGVLWCIPVIGPIVILLVMRRDHVHSVHSMDNNKSTLSSKNTEEFIES